MRLAAIDIGTNSVHMIVVQVRPDRSFDVIDSEKIMVRLGAGGLDGRALTEGAMASGLQALATFRRLAESQGVDEIVASATSAVREAENAQVFLDAVQRQTGIRVQVISGTQEARLIHRAAAYGVDLAGGTAVVIDIGGGSVEMTLGTATHVQRARSFKLGVLRLTERFVDSDPLSPASERKLARHVSKEISDYVDGLRERGFDRVIGTSGTILSLGGLAIGSDRSVGSRDLRNRQVDAKRLHRLRKEIVSLDLQSRLRLPGLDPRRADLAVAGGVLLDTIVRRLGAPEFTLCDLALREGLVLDYIQGHPMAIEHAERYPDVRRRSVIELAERCNYQPEHAQQVARLAVALFDETRPKHGLGDRERDWLEYAGILHDIGSHISFNRHHRHSYYLVKNGALRGFGPEEVESIALVTRYHRRATPKGSHEGYADLPKRLRRTVRLLGAMLRLAEGLDRSHGQSVGQVTLAPEDGQYVLRLEPQGDVELELWAAHRHAGPLEALLGSNIRFEVEETHDSKRTRHATSVSRHAHRRGGNRRVGKDDATRPVGQVAGRGRAPRLRH